MYHFHSLYFLLFVCLNLKVKERKAFVKHFVKKKNSQTSEQIDNEKWKNIRNLHVETALAFHILHQRKKKRGGGEKNKLVQSDLIELLILLSIEKMNS